MSRYITTLLPEGFLFIYKGILINTNIDTNTFLNKINRTSELYIFGSSLILSLPPMLIGIYIWVNVFRFYREVQKKDNEDCATFLVQSTEFLHSIITTEYNHGLIDLDDE